VCALANVFVLLIKTAARATAKWQQAAKKKKTQQAARTSE